VADERHEEVEDRLVERARQHIADHGYHLTYVFGDTTDMPFCYSAGLWRTWNHPELILFGMNSDDSTTVMTALAAEIRDGRSFEAGQIDEETFNRRIAFLALTDDGYERAEIPITVMYYEGWDFPMLQVVTPDEEGLFPWEPGCDPAVTARQPLLGASPE
jgi:Domain of unknown function (DUF4262)